MYILYRLVKNYLDDKVTTSFFSEEFSLIYSRYDGIEKIEELEFGIKYKPELEIIFNRISDMCSRYYENIPDEDRDLYGYTSETVLRDELRKSLQLIDSKGLILIPK